MVLRLEIAVLGRRGARAVTGMRAVEAVLGDRSGVGDDPGDGGELLARSVTISRSGQRTRARCLHIARSAPRRGDNLRRLGEGLPDSGGVRRPAASAEVVSQRYVG